MSGIDSAVRTCIEQLRHTSTTLSGSATFTGTTRDGGADPETWPTRLRPVVRHLTSSRIGHAYLLLEESLNGATWFETRRRPLPADGAFRSFDWPLHYRYHRLTLVNGPTSQSGLTLDSTSYRGEGSSVDEDKVLDLLLSATVPAANATVTSQVIDLGPNSAVDVVRAFVRCDQASVAQGFRIEWSDDGTTFDADATTAVQSPAGAGGYCIESKKIARYCRVLYTNGATAATTFRLRATVVSV